MFLEYYESISFGYNHLDVKTEINLRLLKSNQNTLLMGRSINQLLNKHVSESN